MELTKDFNQALEHWLNQHWLGIAALRLEEGHSQPEGSGFSATTLILPVSFERNGQRIEDRVVVRINSNDEAMFPQQTDQLPVEIELQYRAIDLFSAYADIPVAPLIGYEPDGSILGAPFFVMAYIPGEVPIENPIYTREGFFVEAKPQQRAELIKSGLQTLANIHSIDWQQAGVEWLLEGEPGMLRQIDLWQDFTRRELKGRVHPVIDRAFAWLRDNIPSDQKMSLCWGDSRPGNIIWQNFNTACVCDFENMAIAPAEMDLGWWLMFDRYAHEAQGVARLEGELTRNEQKAYYQQCVGQPVGDITFYELFAAVRYASLVVRVMNRWVANGDLPESQTIWLENPVAEMLAVMMTEMAIPA